MHLHSEFHPPIVLSRIGSTLSIIRADASRVNRRIGCHFLNLIDFNTIVEDDNGYLELGM